MKHKKYILLTILCVISIILLQSYLPSQSSLKLDETFLPDKTKLLFSPYVFPLLLLILTYLALFITGIFNIVSFVIRKLFRRPMLSVTEEIKEFPLSAEKSGKLFFLISLFVLLSYILQFYISQTQLSRTPEDLMNLMVILNLILETAVFFTILKFLPAAFLNFRVKKEHLYTLIKIYSTAIPLIICAILINNFLMRKAGIPPAYNPAIELLILLKSKFSIFILSLQVIILGPVAEELFFRGFLYKLLRKKYSFMFSAGLISIFFAVMHGTPQDTLALFILSMAICYLYEKTQNILSPIILHSLHNSLNFCMIMLLKNMI